MAYNSMKVVKNKIRQTFFYPIKLIETFSIKDCLRLFIAYTCGIKLLQVRSRKYPHPFWLRPRTSDIRVAYEIFTKEELAMEWPLKTPPSSIIDGGANVGYATLALKNRWSDSQIVAYEPDHSNFSVLSLNCRKLSTTSLVEKGIWGKPCKLRVRPETTSTAWGLQFEPTFEFDQNGIPADSIPMILETLPKKHCDLLKLDIEGAETNVFSQEDLSWIKQVSVIIIETHGHLARQAVERTAKSFNMHSRMIHEKLMLWHNT